jgi:SAM-dependent methyltransferase
VVGADRSEGMLGRADATFPRALADAARLPFWSASFDVVVLAFVLFHIPEPAAALAEVRRVLRTGGTVGLTTWGSEETVPARAIWTDELDRGGAAPASALIAHDLVDEPAKLCALLNAAGFAEPLVVSVPWTFLPSREDHVARATQLGAVARRLSGLDPADQVELVRRVRARLAALPDDTLVERGEVLAVTAAAG